MLLVRGPTAGVIFRKLRNSWVSRVGRIYLETFIAAPRERCFDLSLDVDRHKHSMSRTGERAVAGVTRGMMGLGDTVTWEARHFGIPWRLTVRITQLDRPHRFVDEQLHGPFAAMRHEHRFAPVAGGTLMADDFQFEVPLGRLGVIVDALVLERYMRQLLGARNEYLKGVAESEGR